MKFKLITFNIWHGAYLDKVVDFLVTEQADIVMLQEVGTKGRALKPSTDNIYNILKKALSLQGDFLRLWTVDDKTGEWDMGIATFTRFPITSVDSQFYQGQYQRLPAYWDDNPEKLSRGYLKTEVDIGGTTLDIVNTHFTWSPQGRSTKAQQEDARSLRSHLVGNKHMIFAGDMNAPVGSKTLQMLQKGLSTVGKENESTLQPTIHPVGHLQYHVDHAFYRGSKLKHLSTRIPVIDASDHLPIVCEFKVI